jgi:cytochrome c biogenesis protein CcmG, thiol:disulfide interchange protein DsbE
MNKNRLLQLAPLAVFLGMVVFFLLALYGEPQSKTRDHIGETVPAFAFNQLGDASKNFTPQDWQGKIYVINFFASWCMPCRVEHPLLKQLTTAHKIPLLGIAYKDKPVSTNKMLSELGDPFTLVVTDLSGRGGIEWGLTGVPETFLIDAHGTIVWHHVGPLTEKIITAELLPAYTKLSP